MRTSLVFARASYVQNSLTSLEQTYKENALRNFQSTLKFTSVANETWKESTNGVLQILTRTESCVDWLRREWQLNRVYLAQL